MSDNTSAAQRLGVKTPEAKRWCKFRKKIAQYFTSNKV
jgi:hypothetical protein